MCSLGKDHLKWDLGKGTPRVHELDNGTLIPAWAFPEWTLFTCSLRSPYARPQHSQLEGVAVSSRVS